MQLLKEVGVLFINILSQLRVDRVTRLLAMLVAYVAVVLKPVINVRGIVDLLAETFKQWNEDRAPQLAAGLAYYTVFALAPALVIVVAVAGIVFERNDVRTMIIDEMQNVLGQETAQIVNRTMDSLLQPRSGVIATVISIVVVLFGAIGVLGHLQISLDIIWQIEKTPEPGLAGILHWLKRTLLSLLVVVAGGFLLILFMVLNTVLAVINNYLEQIGSNIALLDMLPISQLGNTLLIWAVISLLFALIYRTLTDTHIPWSDVWVGAVTTGLLFLIGQDLIGRYISESGVGSVYGAAGALIVLLVWVYYSAQIFLFGAELTKVYAHQYGSRSPRARRRAAREKKKKEQAQSKPSKRKTKQSKAK
ncbi:MAG: YihY/virulence factor BrkB family protein [Anaerolineae bacterium]|nr:YihY/virulence factor BrkB family protein [Anaerolineae bacterium]